MGRCRKYSGRKWWKIVVEMFGGARRYTKFINASRERERERVESTVDSSANKSAEESFLLVLYPYVAFFSQAAN